MKPLKFIWREFNPRYTEIKTGPRFLYLNNLYIGCWTEVQSHLVTPAYWNERGARPFQVFAAGEDDPIDDEWFATTDEAKTRLEEFVLDSLELTREDMAMIEKGRTG